MILRIKEKDQEGNRTIEISKDSHFEISFYLYIPDKIVWGHLVHTDQCCPCPAKGIFTVT